MKHSLLTLILILNAISSFSQTKFAAKHQKALVYLQGATLTAMAQATLNPGKNTVIITGLSGNLQSESVRIKGDGVKIQNFTHQLNYLEIDNKNKIINTLHDELESITNAITKLDEQKEILIQEKNMILSNQTVAGTDFGLDPTKLSQLADFFRNRLNDILNKEQALDQEIKAQTEKAEKISKQIRATSNQVPLPTAEIEITLEVSKSGTIPIQIEYYINTAGWIPTYDLKVNTLDKNYQLDYLASIYQNSGIDWVNMEVAVSSSDPSNSITGVNLKPWHINSDSYKLKYDLLGNNTSSTLYGSILNMNGEPIPFANIKVVGSSLGSTSDANGRYTIQLTPESKIIQISALGYEKMEVAVVGGFRNFYLQDALSLGNSTITITRSQISKLPVRDNLTKNKKVKNDNISLGFSNEDYKITESNAKTNATAVNVEYTIKEKVDIKSDGKPLNFLIQKTEIPGTYNSIVYPKINNNAFLNIYLLEWEKLNLLEGEVNMFFGNSFIGKTSLNMNQVSDSLRFDFGKDPNIKTIRTLLNAKTSNQALSSNKQSVYRWETEVRNIANFETKVKIVEPFPISQNKEIKVDLDKDLSGANVNSEKGLLTWEITLKPGESRKISYGFSITYPKTMQIRID